MEMSADLIKQNHNLLKTCISYEVLQKKPIFHSYKNFCKTVGQDAMEYRDFEFWYYRFYHGEHDFDYDRSVDPEPKTLMDMPVKLMHKIGEYLDPVERAFLRSMNHAIKNVADSFPPVFEKIEITLHDTSKYWNFDNHNFSSYNKSFMHLTSVLKQPNLQVNHLSLQLFDETLNRDNLLPIPLSSKSVLISGRTTNQVVQFLSAITPGYLESICIDRLYLREGENFGMIYETDQFKQAKSVEFQSCWTSFNVEDLVHFRHLKSFKCFLTSENTFEDVPRILDIIFTFEELESCELDYHAVSDGLLIRVFAVALEAEIPIGPLKEGESLTITHRYQIPESNECLQFKITEKNKYSCLVNIVKIR
ncbi:unnamed protein product [Caenorhabditis nigoni]